jgi:hypothetical protein
MDVKPQIPAEGILLVKDYGDAMNYLVECQCSSEKHSHHIFVEAEDVGPSVTIYTEETTDFWTEIIKTKFDISNEILQKLHWVWTSLINGFIRRIELTYDIWIKGKVTYSSTIIMSEQQALNYAAALKNSIEKLSKPQNNEK